MVPQFTCVRPSCCRGDSATLHTDIVLVAMTTLPVTLRLGQKVKVNVTLGSTCNDEGFTSVISCNIYYALKPYT